MEQVNLPADGLRWLKETLRGGPSRRWVRRPLSDAYVYWKDALSDRRVSFVRRVLGDIDFSSLLEVGSGPGPNLVALRKTGHSAKLIGFDVAKRAIDLGNILVQHEGLTDIQLHCVDARKLRASDWGLFDVVFSWATLIYVQGWNIRPVLRNLLRLTSRYMILVEMNWDSDGSASWTRYSGGNRLHDYRRIIHSVEPRAEVSVSAVPKEVWNPGGGVGSVILVKMPCD